jgi:hypothetical protein
MPACEWLQGWSFFVRGSSKASLSKVPMAHRTNVVMVPYPQDSRSDWCGGAPRGD